MPSRELSVIVPAYNEEEGLERNMLELKEYLDSLSVTYEIIISCNGCTDNTFEIARNLSKKYVDIIAITTTRKGMGAGIINGIKYSTGKFVTFVGADGEVLYNFIELALHHADTYNLITGSRYLVKGQVHGSNWKRMMLSVIYSKIVNLLISSHLTEVGTIKFMEGDWVRKLNLIQNDASIQVELLYHALKGNHAILEIPVVVQIKRESYKSKVSILKASWSFLKWTLYYAWRLRL